jgi:hypothetical protein
MRALLVAVFAAAALLPATLTPGRAADFSDRPPPGIRPASATLKQVLKAHERATGSDAVPVRTVVERGSVEQDSLSGSYTEVHAGKNYRATITTGPFVHAFGLYRGQLWRQDDNGVVVLMNGVHRRDEIDEEALHGDVSDPKNGVRLLGEVNSPFAAYVVEVNPPGGRLQWLFYDKTSGLLKRVERMYPDRRTTTTYEDFHTVNGVTAPWRSRSSDGRPNNDEQWTITSLTYNAKVGENELRIPPQSSGLVAFPPGVGSVALPARIVDRHVIVRVVINGRGLDFILDSGSSGIAVDRQVLAQLGIAAVGSATQTMAGTYERTKARIPQIDIGALRMRDVVVSSFPFSTAHGPAVRAVGLLGFDFIANAVLRIDYLHGLVEAIEPRTFIAPAGAVPVDAALDDGVPFVRAQVGDAIGEHFVLDTGATANILFSAFTSAHPGDVADEGGGMSFNEVNPVYNGKGVGGSLALRATQVKRLRFAGTDFDDTLLFKTSANRPFEGEDEDGLLGYDLLKYFTVCFDYPQRRLYFLPNSLVPKRAVQR